MGQAIRLDDEASLGAWISRCWTMARRSQLGEFANGRSQFKVRRVTPSGQRSAAVDVPVPDASAATRDDRPVAN